MANRRFNISEFTAEIGKKGVAKSNLFSVSITLPEALRFLFDTSVIPLRVESASIPQRSLMTLTQRYYGPERKIPYSFMNQTMRLNIVLSDTMVEREIFMAWQDLAVSGGRIGGYRKSQNRPILGFGGRGLHNASYYDEITGLVDILQFAENPTNQVPSAIEIASGVLQGDILNLTQDLYQAYNPIFQNYYGSNDRPIFPRYRIQLQEAYPLNVSDVVMDWSQDGIAKLAVDIEYFVATERHPESLPMEALTAIESLGRGIIGGLNQFGPVLGLFRREGLAGGSRALAQRIGIPRPTGFV